MNEATRDFVRLHANDDVRRLALQGTKDPEVDLPWALDQIAGRQKARTKLPSWAETEGLEYPPHLSMEQCSSEATARYKASMVAPLNASGSLLDMTGGFGVDFSFMARDFDEAVYVERQPQLCAIAERNFKLLGLNAEVVCGDGVDYLERTDRCFDLIYLDPARRDDHGGRTYAISDCTPDVLSLLPLLLKKGRRTIVKLSPMLDWRKAVSDVGEKWVREVHIVSATNLDVPPWLCLQSFCWHPVSRALPLCIYCHWLYPPLRLPRQYFWYESSNPSGASQAQPSALHHGRCHWAPSHRYSRNRCQGIRR